jgi:hypothetical protein
METSNIIALVLGGTGFIVSVVGFIITPLINLKSKRLEKRLDYRFELFQKILELWECTHNKSDVMPVMGDVNKLIQLYGKNSEITAFNMVVSSYNKYAMEKNESNEQELKRKFENFFSISFNAYRKEIRLGKLGS